MHASQNYETILSQIYELLDPLVEEEIDFKEESDFVADLGFDSSACQERHHR